MRLPVFSAAVFKPISMNSKFLLRVLLPFILGVSLFKVKLLFDNHPIEGKLLYRAAIGTGIVLFFTFLNSVLNKTTIIKLFSSRFIFSKYLIPNALFISVYLFFFLNKEMLILPTKIITLTALSTFILASAEEVMFRYYYFNFFMKQGISLKITGIYTSILFALAHISNIDALDISVLNVINQIIFAFFTGLLLFSLLILTRNYFSIFLFHFLINLPTQLDKAISHSKVIQEVTSSADTSILLKVLGIHILFLPLYIISLFLFKRIKSDF